MSDQQPQRLASTASRDAWKTYWMSQGMPWRTEPEIDEARQRYLTERREVQPDIQQGIYPFRDERGPITLTRADVEWLLATHEGGRGPVRWEDPTQRQRRGLDLRGANLDGEDLSSLPLARLHAGVVGGEWRNTTADQRRLAAIHLEGANLHYAHLEGGALTDAHLEGARLTEAHLEAADLFGVRFDAEQPTNLRTAYFDSATKLEAARFANARGVSPRFVDIHWEGASLSAVDWSQIRMLGDEYRARHAPTRGKAAVDPADRARYRLQAVRANRQLATALRAQGLNEDADRFAYRAHVMQQVVLRRQGIKKLPSYFGSILLWALAGYGYRLWRIFVAYALVLLIFAATYFLLGVPNEPVGDVQSHALGALLISVTAIHGRVFFEQFGFTAQAWVAAIESVFGIVIEGIFVAMLIQRWFQR